MGAQAVEERELEGEALGAERGAVRHVDRGHAHAIDHRLDVARLVVAGVARQALAHVLERPPGQDRDAVAPARLAAHRDIVAAVLERLGRKLLGRDLGLLEQRDVGARLIQPLERDAAAGPGSS